jgi:hypothetical protein
MSPDERESADCFGLGNETIEYTKCECGCGRIVSEFDPCIIDGRMFSDHCASDLTYLRDEGYISENYKEPKN